MNMQIHMDMKHLEDIVGILMIKITHQLTMFIDNDANNMYMPH